NITYTTINNFFLTISSNFKRIKSILIKDSKFNIQSPNIFDKIIIEIATSEVFSDTDAKIVKTEINGFKALAISVDWLNSLVIDSCVLRSNDTNASAIVYKAIKNVVVSNSYFRVPKIFNNIRWLDNSAFFIEESLSFKNCTFEFPNIINSNTAAIGIENSRENLRALKIENCNFVGYDVHIYLKNIGRNLIPVIRNNSFNDFKSFGINATNGAGIVIINNQFSSSSQGQSSQKTGIYLSHISHPHIISNNLSLQNQNLPGAGIFLGSSNGEIIGNNISGFRYGIELGSSSPNIGANVITANNENGIYSGAYSNPNLSYTVINDVVYPVSGYNTIRENGLCNFYPGYSEIFLSRSNIQLKGGCNTIADDRDDPPLHCNYLYLIDGEKVDDTIYAGENYWGEINDHNPVGRFGSNITVEYEGYLNEPCSFTNGSDYLLLTDQNGEVYDTIYSMLNNISQLSDIESKYAMANSYFYAKEFSQAKTKYENIVELYGNLRNSLKAYLRLYEIATFINTTPDEFNQLGQYYSQKAEIQTDSVMINVLRHLTSLCFVWSKNYEEALSRFESDIQNSQTNELVLYRTIDILTTSLLIEPDSAVGKRAARFVNIPGNLSYSALISELLKTRGNSVTNELIKVIPKQFNLYQNYPNPFNPNTTIKFDLPKSANVNLSIYDILGRKVKTILNGRKEAGTYQINVDLSELSSGIYFYQLQTDEFVSTRKMLMLK
ncbi:MAG: T9SS type A sorting domain-containing protein, partial [Ignavibacterium sp.]